MYILVCIGKFVDMLLLLISCISLNILVSSSVFTFVIVSSRISFAMAPQQALRVLCCCCRMHCVTFLS